MSIAVLGAMLLACGKDASGPALPSQVQVTATSTALTALGATTQLTAQVLDRSGNPVSGANVTWSSGAESIVQVSSSGLATAIATGTATITATASPAIGTIQITVDQVPTALDLVSGAGQTGQVGQQLPQPIRFRVSDSNGRPAAGKTVQLTVTRGGGSAVTVPSVTQSDGTFDAVWTLGTDASQVQELTAALGAITRAVAATARPGPASAVRADAGAAQTGLAGEPLADSVTARVVDQYDNPITGATVSWSVRSGGGAITPATSITGADGRARARWTLGPNSGQHEVQGGTTGATAALFSATAQPNGIIEGTVTVTSFLMRPQGPALVDLAGPDLRRARAAGPLTEGNAAEVIAHTARPDVVPGQWVVRIRDNVLSAPARMAGVSSAAAQAMSTEMRVQLAAVAPVAEGKFAVDGISPALGVARVRAVGPDAGTALAELRSDPRVESVEPLILYHSTGGAPAAVNDIPDVRYFPRQSWHYGFVGVPRAWHVSLGHASVIVAVIDDGIRFDHVSVASTLTSDGYDFVSDEPLPLCSGGQVSNSGNGGPGPNPTVPFRYDWHSSAQCLVGPSAIAGHGLHVAGTIAANGGGLVGVAPGVRIRPIRVLGTSGSGTNYDIAQGVLYAAGLPADNGRGGLIIAPSRSPIINMSLGGPNDSAIMASAVAQASVVGSLIIVSAGNAGTAVPNYPAAYPQAMSVSALGPSFGLAPYSSYGTSVEVSAPGGDKSLGDGAGIWSSVWNFQTGSPALASYQGTSMASPHVAGVAALILSRFPGMTAAQIRQRLIATSIDLGPSGWDQQFGYGMVNAYSALTDGAGLPSTLRVQLFNATSGALVASAAAGAGLSFRFPGLADGNYYVFAGGDDRNDGVVGRPGFQWGARGGSTTPAAINITGYGPRNGSFVIGWPVEKEPNNGPSTAAPLMIGGYAHGSIDPATDFDYYRIQVPQSQTVTFETGGWYGLCGFGNETDTLLDLFTPAGVLVATHDDIDFSRDRLCARLTTALGAGTYYLRVRGYAKGLYTVQARVGT